MSPASDVRVLGEGRWLRLVDDGGWEYAERSGGNGVVVIVAVTDDDRLVLVEQYRPAVKACVIEAPAGLVGDLAGSKDEDRVAAARRELLEETGYEAERMEHLLEAPSSPGMIAETYHFYCASGLRKTGPGGGDPSEDIRVLEVPLAEAREFVRDQQARGARVDTKLLAALYLAGAPGSE